VDSGAGGKNAILTYESYHTKGRRFERSEPQGLGVSPREGGSNEGRWPRSYTSAFLIREISIPSGIQLHFILFLILYSFLR
jgi:hypothetical protein